jgi:hypothetical protein
MIVKQFLAVVLSSALVLATSAFDLVANNEVPATVQPAVQPGQVTAEQLQQLVAPIALYPDELVAEILAASTYPTEIFEADSWLRQNSGLKGTQLASEVDKQSWDPSVKALTQFPSVLANMNKNLSWTSALGDAYFSDQQGVLKAVQVMRKRAQDAGTLKSTPQQTVTMQDQTISIEPSNPEIVYLPVYDPWTSYGAPVAVYPSYIAGPWSGAPIISFGVGFPIGGSFDWGWNAWGCDWGGDFVVFNHARFISRSHTFFSHGRGFVHRGDFHDHDFIGHFDHRADRGFVAPHVEPGGHPGAFSGFDHGGVTNQHSFRGRSSLGGAMHSGVGGGMRGGGGGFMRGGGGGGHR